MKIDFYLRWVFIVLILGKCDGRGYGYKLVVCNTIKVSMGVVDYKCVDAVGFGRGLGY